jgi:hypothetical protein
LKGLVLFFEWESPLHPRTDSNIVLILVKGSEMNGRWIIIAIKVDSLVHHASPQYLKT